MWEEILKVLSSSRIVVVIAAPVVKLFINHRLNKDILSVRQSLENNAKLDFERYKAELEKERLRLQISYGGIFEKQANAILETYNALLVILAEEVSRKARELLWQGR